MTDNWKKPLLDKVKEWIRILGAVGKPPKGKKGIRATSNYVRALVKYPWSDEPFPIYIYPVDRSTLEFRAPYYPRPQGDVERVWYWETELETRKQGNAAMQLTDDKTLWMVRAQLLLTDNEKGDLGVCWYTIHSLGEYLKFWSDDYDIMAVEEFGLTFGEVAIKSLLS